MASSSLHIIGCVSVVFIVLCAVVFQYVPSSRRPKPATPKASTRASIPSSASTFRDFPACFPLNSTNESSTIQPRVHASRIVAVGDVHGNYQGLLDVLTHAGIINTISSTTATSTAINSTSQNQHQYECEWANQREPVLLVQVGDIVDRGRNATGAWHCLRYLQSTASSHGGGSSVVRLIGNHELFWLEGRFQHRNKKYDTKTKTMALLKLMKEELASKAVLGSYAVRLPTGADVLFVHAGLRPTFLEYIASEREKEKDRVKEKQEDEGKTEEVEENKKTLTEKSSSSIQEEQANHSNAFDVAQWINDASHKDIIRCLAREQVANIGPMPCSLKSPIYSAGPDRGGNGIGGPYWTDFRTLKAIGEYTTSSPWPFIQVVGHTADPGNIRFSKGLAAICIDGGMQYGGRTYLEITREGHIISHVLQDKKLGRGVDDDGGGSQRGVGFGQWLRTDLTAQVCV